MVTRPPRRLMRMSKTALARLALGYFDLKRRVEADVVAHTCERDYKAGETVMVRLEHRFVPHSGPSMMEHR